MLFAVFNLCMPGFQRFSDFFYIIRFGPFLDNNDFYTHINSRIQFPGRMFRLKWQNLEGNHSIYNYISAILSQASKRCVAVGRGQFTTRHDIEHKLSSTIISTYMQNERYRDIRCIRLIFTSKNGSHNNKKCLFI